MVSITTKPYHVSLWGAVVGVLILALVSASLVLSGLVQAQEEFKYAENGRGAVATFTAADPEGKAIVWSLAGDDAADFSIANGVLTFNSPPDFEMAADTGANNVYSVTVQAGDGGATPATEEVTITVTNVEEPGTVTLGNLQPQAGVDLTATLTDPDETISGTTWKWESSSDRSSWAEIEDATAATYSPVDGDVGRVLRATASYTDGEGADKSAMAMSANAVRGSKASNTAPAFKDADDMDVTSVDREVAENTPAGEPVGDPVAAADAEDDILTYTLEGDGADSFAIDVATGQLRTMAALDEETAPSYTVTVRATDPSGGTDNSDTVTVAITVTDVDEDPSITTGATAIDHEEDETDLVLATYVATDPEDQANDLTWDVSGADSGKFEISAAGALSFMAAPDFEAPGDADGDNVYEVTVEVTDSGNNTATRDVTVKVTNADEDGEITLSGLQPRVDVQFSAEVTDPDGGVSNIVWRWTTGACTGTVEDVAEGDELSMQAAYTPVAGDVGETLCVRARYTDGEGEDKDLAQASANAVQSEPANKPPAFPDQDTETEGEQTDQERTVAENTAAATAIGDVVTATDPNGDILQYTLGGPDAASFTIDRANGQLSTKAALDFEDEETHTVEVTATDSSNASATVTVTIKVTGVDEQPELMGDDEAEYAENGTGPVATYTAADPEGKTIVWSLAGDDAADFSIANGVLTFNSPPDFEMAADTGANNVYSVTVQAGDGGATPATEEVTITVTNVEEPGTVTLGNLQPQAGVDLTATLTDPDETISGTTWKWESSSDRSSWAEIEDATAATYSPVDGDVGRVLRATASYTDGEGADKSAMAMSANAVRGSKASNTAPAFKDADDMDVTSVDREVAENTPAGEPVGDPVAAADAEDDILTYTLEGDGADSFAIDVATGQLRTMAALDEETAPSYTVTVRATDPSGGTDNSDTVTVAITVTDVDEDPSITTGATAIDHEEDETDLVLATYVATDPEDQANDLTWDVSGADSGKFEISAAGALSFMAAPDFEAPGDADGDNVYEVTVEVTDSGNNTATRDVTVKVTNADEDGEITLSGLQPRVDVQFSAEVTDPDGGVSNIVWRWTTGACTGTVEDVAEGDELSMQAAYTPVAGDVGETLCVRARYTDGEGEDKDLAQASANAVQSEPANKPPAFPDQDTETEGEQTDQERTVAENTAAATAIGDVVTATDPNGDILQYTLGGPDAASFTIDRANGQLSTKAALDFEDEETHTVEVTATDSSNASATVTVTIEVTNVDEPPTISLGGLAINGPSSHSYEENGTDAVETYTASGPNAAMATWSLGGPDAGDFTIAGGVLAFTATPDFENAADADTDNVYMVTVKADDGTYMDTRDVRVTVTDVEDTPVEPESLLDRYDTNGSGRIDKDELADGVFDYNIEQTLSKDDLADLIFSYEIG